MPMAGVVLGTGCSSEFVAIAEGRSPFMGQCHHCRVKIGEDCINRTVGGNGPAMCLGHRADAPMNGGG